MASVNKCRACISSLDESIMNYDMKKIPVLAQKFVSCTDLIVSEDEPLPTVLCQDCFDQLEQLYKFRAKCIAADTMWRREMLAFCDEVELESIVELEIEEEPQPASPVEVTELELPVVSEAEIEVIDIKAESDMDEGEPPSDDDANLDSLETKSDEDDADADETCSQEDTVEMEVLELNAEPEGEPESKSEEPKMKIYKCDFCSVQFLDLNRLHTHHRQHGVMPFPCPEPDCDRGYSHKHSLKLHIRKAHNNGKEPKPHVCEFCGKMFDTMSVLKNHRFTHKDKSELPHHCEEENCDRRFATKQLLKVHMMRHAGIKNYTCSFCGVQKTTRTELKIHLNYHTLEKSYSCSICGKILYSSSNLSKHMRKVHEQGQKYECSYCGRTFTQHDIRDQHELIHTGEKPHECEECGKRFRQKSALRTHAKIHKRKAAEKAAGPSEKVVKKEVILDVKDEFENEEYLHIE
ncbi:maker650 [Drosophila busckii]|uniref:Maker650 n=1 Tax=Drosophila busckii TaxID=30019 RepID=A0A0M3QVY8_DROBS|nr:zinc finger protein 771 [Drosophila busckii]ALC43223.1 maker650 [Drosophila busckii]